MDKVAEAHDLRYLASVDNDVGTAYNRMIESLQKAQAQKLDSYFYINQAMVVKGEILLEDKLGVPKTVFTTFGRQNKPQAENTMYENKIKEVQQQGFGMSYCGIHTKH